VTGLSTQQKLGKSYYWLQRNKKWKSSSFSIMPKNLISFWQYAQPRFSSYIRVFYFYFGILDSKRVTCTRSWINNTWN